MRRAAGAAALGVLLILAAAAFDSSALYVPGLALSGLSLGAALWVSLAAGGARVVRELGPPSVEEHAPYPVRITVHAGLVPPPGGEVYEPIAAGGVALRMRRSQRVRLDVRFARRGRRPVEPTRVLIGDPLGLAQRELLASDRAEVLVLPRVEPVLAARGSGAAGLHAGESAQHLALAAAELELDSLRPYRPGTAASRIHWPSTLRAREMMERHLLPDADSRPLVVLDACRPDSEESLDLAVRAAASLCVHLARAGGCALLLPGERRPRDLDPAMHAWPAAHARLALVEAGGPPPSLARLARSGAVVWVSAAAGGEASLALRRAGGAARYLVAPGPGEDADASFTVAGCFGRRVSRAGGRAAA